MEIAAIHNMRAILRYYKKADEGLTEAIQALSGFITEVNEGKTIDSLMLSEARARQVYGVYLNRDGKKTLIEAFEGKMAAQLVIEGKRQTYRHLMIHEVKNFLALIADGAEYRPYKYY